MNNRQLGSAGPRVSAIGLRLTAMSALCRPTEEDESVSTIRAAIDAGITFLDTGDFHGMGHNELLIRDALRGGRRDAVQISVKFGIKRDPAGGVQGVDTRPVAVKDSLAYTLRRLDTDFIDVYRPAQLSRDVPVEDTIGAIAELVKDGYVRHIGMSSVDAKTLRRANAVHPISDVQVEYPHIAADGAEVVRTARELGIGVTALGLLTDRPLGHTCADCTLVPDVHWPPPRPAGDELDRALSLMDALEGIAVDTAASANQLAIAWVLSHGPHTVALVDATRREQLAGVLAVPQLRLSAQDLARVGDLVRDWSLARSDVEALPLEVADALPVPSRHRSDTIPLTNRENEVLDLVMAGMTNRGVASRLGISERTAREHVARILLKLHVQSRVEAAVVAMQWRLIQA